MHSSFFTFNFTTSFFVFLFLDTILNVVVDTQYPFKDNPRFYTTIQEKKENKTSL